MSNSPIRLAVFDVDGTLVNARHPLGDAQIHALRGLHQAGIHVAIASSRQQASLVDIADAVGVPMHLIAFNGTLITDPARRTLDAADIAIPATLADALARYVAAGGCVHIYTEQDWYAFGPDARINNEASGKDAAPGVRAATLDPAVLPTRALKLMCDGNIAALDDVRDTVAKHPEFVMSWSGTECYDIHAKDGTKGHALLKLCDILGIDPADTAAFGDADSDVTMLRNAGVGFAMGDAAQAVLTAADRRLDAPGSGALEALLAKWAS